MEPVERQNTAAPKFGVAHGALDNEHVLVDLKLLRAGQQGGFSEKLKTQKMTLTLMVFVTQKISLVTKIGNLSNFFPF